MADDIWTLLGLGKPFIYGGAAYGLFHWLDKNASDEAKASLSQLLRIKNYDTKQLAVGLVDVFDRLYTYPLLTWRAFMRSAVFSLVILGPILYETSGVPLDIEQAGDTFSFLAIAVLSDYCSLFFIRRWITFSGSRPFIALLGGLFIACLIVTVGGAARITVAAHSGAKLIVLQVIGYGIFLGRYESLVPLLAFPGIIVFAWLPLFALGIFVIRASNLIAAAVGKVQWFLKEGKEHPLEAIGYIAGIAVFLIVAGWQLFITKAA
jgi:hypothetical protein